MTTDLVIFLVFCIMAAGLFTVAARRETAEELRRNSYKEMKK